MTSDETIDAIHLCQIGPLDSEIVVAMVSFPKVLFYVNKHQVPALNDDLNITGRQQFEVK